MKGFVKDCVKYFVTINLGLLVFCAFIAALTAVAGSAILAAFATIAVYNTLEAKAVPEVVVLLVSTLTVTFLVAVDAVALQRIGCSVKKLVGEPFGKMVEYLHNAGLLDVEFLGLPDCQSQPASK